MRSGSPGQHPVRRRLEAALDTVVRHYPAWDGTLYAAYSCGAVLLVASLFYGQMLAQTQGIWSAPLDDVFIHFDYARASARGSWFQWTEGNGYSSGNTSLLYPLVLACGYLAGFRGGHLMVFAAVLAGTCTWVFLLTARQLLEPLGRWAKYLLPPLVLCIGALDWTLFSGMENALHLSLWGLLLWAVLRVEGLAGAGRSLQAGAWLAGGLGALLFATRPESVICLGAFAWYAVLAAKRSPAALHPWRLGLATGLRIASPGALILVAQTAANRLLTGEWSANGAICKLTLNNPYMTREAKLQEYLSNLDYVVRRNLEHHFTDVGYWGWLVPALGLLPLAHRPVRAKALLLWVQVGGWLGLVALNGQVRWQNERYTMPAVAWALTLAAMGLGVLTLRRFKEREAPTRTANSRRVVWLGRCVAAWVLGLLFWEHQAPCFGDQVWFFGRASRNIQEQHVVAGAVLGRLGSRRVLVGDAGALLYASDTRGLDLIGLGGYHDLPFARAGVHGLGASLELIERMPPGDRPDTMALYPSWWAELPAIFGRRFAEVPVAGNVICGGASKVLYRADWSALDDKGQGVPESLRAEERVVDELDQADLVSEKLHHYNLPKPNRGFVGFRVLPRARPATGAAVGSDRGAEFFDAGRIAPPDEPETAELHAPVEGGRLVVRSVTEGRPLRVRAAAGDQDLGWLVFPAEPGWQEATVALPSGLPELFELKLQGEDAWWLDTHVWVLGPRSRVAPKSD